MKHAISAAMALSLAVPSVVLAQTGALDSNRAGAASTQAAGALHPGANSFTQGQARARIQDHGFQNVTDLRKDRQGIWRGHATRDGKPVDVALDYQGNVVSQ
jgi:hypothetical protein